MEYTEVCRASSPRGEVVLRERREEGREPVLELRANGVFVMDTAETSSERELAGVALRQHPRPRRVLIGGLGLGFTLDAVLADPDVEAVTVAEIEPALVDWMRDGTVPHGPALLADPRVLVVVGDLADVVRGSAPATYDLVLLDVDNGPDHLVHDANAALYRDDFVREVGRTLAPGGVVLVWSAAESPALGATIERVLGQHRSIRCPVDLQGRAETYWLHAGSQRLDDRTVPDAEWPAPTNWDRPLF